VLIPDFKGSLEALKIVMDARPEILNHNVETVPRLFKQVQPQDRYEWAAATLSSAKKLDPEVLTKSGIMVGLGETLDEVKEVMCDQRQWGVDILTVGQYLQPSKKHLPIARYYTPEEFAEIKRFGLEIGFRWVESGPLVRSSYHAAEQVRALSAVHRKLYGETQIEEAPRESFPRQRASQPHQPVHLVTSGIDGLLPSVDLDDPGALLDLMETPSDSD
jgi:lipoic acid synthetase